MKIKISREVSQRVERLQADGKCLACECEILDGERVTCGIHADSCYQSQNYAIRKGLVTLAELLRTGQRLVPKSGGRKPRSAYSAKLLGREGEQCTAEKRA